jgi:hypothetical protein
MEISGRRQGITSLDDDVVAKYLLTLLTFPNRLLLSMQTLFAGITSAAYSMQTSRVLNNRMSSCRTMVWSTTKFLPIRNSSKLTASAVICVCRDSNGRFGHVSSVGRYSATTSSSKLVKDLKDDHDCIPQVQDRYEPRGSGTAMLFPTICANRVYFPSLASWTMLENRQLSHTRLINSHLFVTI